MKPKLIYVFDALCSWCYAFHQELEKSLKEFPELDLQLVNGGMFRTSQHLKASDIANPETFKFMYKQVAERGHVEITEKYTEDLLVGKNPEINSERPARGICQFRDSGKTPKEQLQFVHDLQLQMYVDGVDPNSNAYFTNVLPKYNLSADLFIENVDTTKYELQAKKDFDFTQELGVQGFPQLIIQTAEKQFYIIAKGYTDSDSLNSRIKSVLKEVEAK